MTNKHLGNQTSAALQMDNGVDAELKNTTHQQCGWFSRNLLLALTVLGANMCVCMNVWDVCIQIQTCLSFLGSSVYDFNACFVVINS